MQSLLIPFPSDSSRFSLQNSLSNPPGRVFTADELEAGRRTRADKLAKWAALDLRQDFADATFMRSHIKAAGLHAPNWAEPATKSRLRSLLHRAGVDALEVNEAVGTTLSGYLKDELDVEVGGFEAVFLLDFIVDRLGPHIYNQALYDAQAHVLKKLEALGEAVLDLEKPAKL